MDHAIKPTMNRTNLLPAETAELEPLTREMLEEQTREVARTALEECTLDDTVTLDLGGGRTLELLPLDTRRFVMHMSRFISMN